MDLILDAGGAFTWSRGPTTAPVLSIAATRLTLDEPHPVHGRSPQDPETEEVDPSTSGALSDPPDPLRPAGPAWQTRPGGLGHHPVRHRPTRPRRPHRAAGDAGPANRARPQFQSAAGDPDVGRSQGRLSPAGPARGHLPGPRDAALATHAGAGRPGSVPDRRRHHRDRLRVETPGRGPGTGRPRHGPRVPDPLGAGGGPPRRVGGGPGRAGPVPSPARSQGGDADPEAAARPRIGRVGPVDRAGRPAARDGPVGACDGSRRRRLRGLLPRPTGRDRLDRSGQEPEPPGPRRGRARRALVRRPGGGARGGGLHPGAACPSPSSPRGGPTSRWRSPPSRP